MAFVRGVGWVLAYFFGVGGFFVAGASLTMGEAPEIGPVIGMGVGVVLWLVLSRTGEAARDESLAMQQSKAPHLATNGTEMGVSRLPDDWSRALASRGLSRAEIDRTVDGAYRAAPGRVYPEPHEIFRAFDLTPLDAVKVVIVGQDPYPEGRSACGLAFSVPRGVRVPYSLGRVYSRMEAELDPGAFTRPEHGDLTAWARNGVLLLNSALTAIGGKPGSQIADWARFTRTVLEVVNQRSAPVVFMLWGDEAIALGDGIPLDEVRHKVYRSTHPRREEPSRFPRFAGTAQFIGANAFLESKGRGQVNWALD
ncbi:uracil-DNA glycosylase [uncultured Demequina sp.]|uniref:uracil-DNA glycosylase n=1 Tax=uncultured Demequina sp. TaxID=693499 RepID=UPI0025F0C7A2|nr:uracil-DNA glycosylase [uncultured Demequina sp.]